jgi:hypothetical protein
MLNPDSLPGKNGTENSNFDLEAVPLPHKGYVPWPMTIDEIPEMISRFLNGDEWMSSAGYDNPFNPGGDDVTQIMRYKMDKVFM